MKKLLSVLSVTSCLLLAATAQAQLTPLPSFGTEVSNIVSKIDTSVNLFTPKEVEFRLGACYVQKTGEAGTVLAVEKWGILSTNINNFGIGAESITSGSDQAAEFAYVAYRKCLGNVAGIAFLGGGYADIDKSPLGVLGARLEYRTTAHIGTWASASYGLTTRTENKRGLLIAGGLSYAF